jgi:nitrogen regulation protein NR(I)
MMKILVVDDEKMIRLAFEQFLKDEGATALLAGDAEAAIDLVRREKPDIAFVDYRMPGKNGLSLLEAIREIDPGIAVIFMTAFGAMDVAIKAMQLGAYEYVTKPLDLAKMRVLIRRILEGKKNLAGLPETPPAGPGEGSLDSMVGKAPAMQEVFKIIGLLTTQEVTVLITGESGAGKELVARAIHENSPRAPHPFVVVNCAAMPEALLEAEMFGYEKGAFTGAESRKPGKFEAADGGSIFLDEIGELHPSLQVKLLRLLQEKSFERVGGNATIRCDVRIIAATNKDLYREVDAGRFRSDLFYRLHLIHIHLPPLRERKEDIPLLAAHFIRKANAEQGREVRGLTGEAMEKLVSYSWPGNVRQLENEIRRAMVMSRENILPGYLFDLSALPEGDAAAGAGPQLAEATLRYLGETLDALERPRSAFDHIIGSVEKSLIAEALRRTGGNQVHAAELLGMNRSTLRKKRADYGL